MQCEQVRLELQAHEGGELAPDERAAVEAHLTTCQACAEEARAMKGMGDVIRRGLNDWVEKGEVPVDLATRIELHIRPRKKKALWLNWQLQAGVVAAAAAVFMIMFTTQPERLASIPLLGVLASQFISPDFEFPATHSPVLDKLPKPSNPVRPTGATVEKQGITLTVNLIEQVGDLTHVQYTVKGITVDQRLNDAATHPTLKVANGPVSLQSFNAERETGEVLFNAYFAAVQPGQTLTFSIGSLPAGDKMVQGPWQVTVTN